MASKTVKNALIDTLERLSRSELRIFCIQMVNYGTQPWTNVRAFSSQDPTEIADFMVSTFNKRLALTVAVETLTRIGYKDEADRLTSMLEAYGQSFTSALTGPTSEEHFVDRHKDYLIHNVGNVEHILDELLKKGVIQQESYDEISALSTSEEKINELIDGHLKTVGSKDIFHNIAWKNLEIRYQGPDSRFSFYYHYKIQDCTMKCSCSPPHDTHKIYTFFPNIHIIIENRQ